MRVIRDQRPSPSLPAQLNPASAQPKKITGKNPVLMGSPTRTPCLQLGHPFGSRIIGLWPHRMKEILIKKHDRNGVWQRSSDKGVAGDEESFPVAAGSPAGACSPEPLPGAKPASSLSHRRKQKGQTYGGSPQHIHRDNIIPRKAERRGRREYSRHVLAE